MAPSPSKIDAAFENAERIEPVAIPERRTLAGDYLSSIFAQRNNDWKKAANYIQSILIHSPDDRDLARRAMVLAMGAGDFDNAITMARTLNDKKDDNALAQLFLTLDALQKRDYTEAQRIVDALPRGSLSEFLMPLLQSWTRAGNGSLDVHNLKTNTMHIMHAVLIADFLKQSPPVLKSLDMMTEQVVQSADDLERIGDLYVHLGETEKAKAAYERILKQWPEHSSVSDKMADLNAGKKPHTFQPVTSPEQGIARALYDMANILFLQSADDSAQVFTQMALFLNPGMTDARLLLAALDTRNERYEQAIANYRMIPEGDDYFLESRRLIAGLLQEKKDFEGAKTELSTLVEQHNDIESLIGIGDLYRAQDKFEQAVDYYNKAARKLDGIPPEYWQLYYVRGMSYERMGQWDKAEADLKAALAYEPDHPFLLNYLGYSWADQGIKLDEALALLEKANSLQPDDGHIVDSLGWVLYRLGRYDEALKYLEKAVELMPYDSVVNDHLGDNYWMVGRKREARFQWQRALNYSDDEKLSAAIGAKLEHGLNATSNDKMHADNQNTQSPQPDETGAP